MANVSINNVFKRYGTVTAVQDLSLMVRDGEFMVLVGPSGCGKSTALRMIAGLEDISDGQILIDERVVNEVEPRDRDIAMVFQNYALYPHMTVYDNMAFGLKQRRFPKAEIKKRVDEASQQLGLEPLMTRKPGQLSGGQRQRVALGRAIVREPKVFLMDEPLSNLDAQLRVQTRAELIKLHRRLGITTIYVTHDQVEAMTMGQRIAVMKDGILQQCDTPMALYSKPNNMFVAGFIGTPSMNFVEATIVAGPNGAFLIDTGAFKIGAPPLAKEVLAPWLGKKVVWGVRPADLFDGGLANLVKASELNTLSATVDVLEPMGDISMCYLTIGPHKLVAGLNSETAAKEGDTLSVLIDLSKTHLFDPETRLVIR